MEQWVQTMAQEIASLPFIEGVVLGGSRAAGTAGADSDYDIGIYYRKEDFRLEELNWLAKKWDEKYRENLIGPEGSWGNWVNCGGWLTVQGSPVDWILRDADRVQTVVEESERGIFSLHYQNGHPHAYLSAMYRGELAVSNVLCSSSPKFMAMKKQAEPYPEPLGKALIEFFSFEAQFSAMLARKNLQTGDRYYFAAHLVRAVSALNQILFAKNKVYCLNEKKAVLRVESFSCRPDRYRERVDQIFAERSPEKACGALDCLIGEIIPKCKEKQKKE